MKLIPIFAFGTRGDVAPVITILHRLVCAASGPSVKFVLITHQCYAAECSRVFDTTPVEVLGMDSVPVAVDTSVCFSQNYIARFREKFKGATVVTVIANLFALDAWFLAVEWNVQCIFIHPNLPRSEPRIRDSLLSAMESSHPHIHKCVQQNTAVAEQQYLCWTDYHEILWPTLVSEYAPDGQQCVVTDQQESNLPMTGPVLLLLSSPKFVLLPIDRRWLTRYHTCGFIASCGVTPDMHLEELQHINGASELLDLPVVEAARGRSDAVVVLTTTTELLSELAASSSIGNTEPTVCIDFGSMTQVLVEQGRLCHILDIVKQLAASWRFVVICHGYAAQVTECLLKIPLANSGIGHIFVLMRHAVDHAVVFPKCVTVMHHGGIGTVGTCMHCGVPQLILAVMYDQMANGARVQELQLGECLTYDSLHSEYDIAAAGASKSSRATAIDAKASAIEAAALVEQSLLKCSLPVQRLRCACFGRDLRADPAEDGLANALSVLDKYLHQFLHHADQNHEPTVIGHEIHTHTAVTGHDECDFVTNEHGRLVLPNGLQMYTHFTAAPEETVFLYEEIFVHQVYSAAVKALMPGDIVVDVGTNVGMFMLYALQALRCSSNGDSYSGQFRFLAVEPMKASYDLLVGNAQYHQCNCVAYNCAIGAANSSDAVPAQDVSPILVDVVRSSHGCFTKEQVSTLATKVMHYFPRLPGNSCCATKVKLNLATQAQVMNPSVFNSACRLAVTVRCPAMSLSAVLDDYWNHRSRPEGVGASKSGCARGTKRTAGSAFGGAVDGAVSTASANAATSLEDALSACSIALLKVDVEGDELEVLQSLNAAHWACVERVIVEAALCLEQAIVELLCAAGFCRDRISTDTHNGCGSSSEAGYVTGNVIIFATRL